MTVTFDGATVNVIGTKSYGYSIIANATQLYNGKTYAELSPETSPFPKEFDCYCTNISEITTLAGKIGSFCTLVIDSDSFTNCYISKLGDIKEVEGDFPTGKWTYTIEFSRHTA
ncbi:hypothetical protein [Methanosarcina acetivorans]|uniref:Uncharacterized protein n=1 Tax=Methanosarcina acetivorans (strain ATCC 35395 / DSM 2834 / JCM 12185 / C2A) TaxID=188937 RepID=Q8TJI0_METAC|nr:hypothetical protein [Methanosarcina acetivorans]AAM07155.1 predicted protein [Methanosarcina acetivorans C2A]